MLFRFGRGSDRIDADSGLLFEVKSADAGWWRPRVLDVPIRKTFWVRDEVTVRLSLRYNTRVFTTCPSETNKRKNYHMKTLSGSYKALFGLVYVAGKS